MINESFLLVISDTVIFEAAYIRSLCTAEAMQYIHCPITDKIKLDFYILVTS